MDWQLTCRVCLETGDMVSLFDWDENNEQLGDKYTYCSGVEVSKNDSLPTLICLNCVDRLTFAYQFKQQCLASNETLKECLEEFEKSSHAVSTANTSKATETETITIKQENGLLLQYELPVEHDPQGQWTRTHAKHGSSVLTKAPGPRKRGRPRKYPNELGSIELSPYMRKKAKAMKKETQALTTLLASGSLDMKQEPDGEDQDPYSDFGGDDPDFNPSGDDQSDTELKVQKKEKTTPRKRGRPRKPHSEKKKKSKVEDNGEDVLLKETILAFSEPIPDHILNPKPKKKYTGPKKKYHNEKTHTCETCGSSFTSNASLQTHIRRHLGIKPFVCSVCGHACVENIELRRHMLRHTGVRPYKCRICDRRFGDFGSRQKHESVCGFATTMRLNLMRHMRRHTGERPYKCQFCERAFKEHGDRQKHESVCGYASVLNEALKKHMLKHTGERPYKCRICERRFADFGTRQKHESVCGYASVSTQALRKHMLTHTGERPYKCRVCDRRFGDMSTRHKHESVCGYSCVMNEALKRHMLRHTGERPYKCRICDRRFGDYGTRQKHERLHMGLRPYQCSLCGKAFTYSYVLSNHMLTHTGEKKYSCAPCNKKFTKAHHLKYHNKVHHKDLYVQQQLEAEAKKLRQQMNVTGLSGVVSGQVVDGTLHLVQTNSEDGEPEHQMQVVLEGDEGDDGNEDKETHRAVADMQAVVLDSEFSIDEDCK